MLHPIYPIQPVFLLIRFIWIVRTNQILQPTWQLTSNQKDVCTERNSMRAHEWTSGCARTNQPKIPKARNNWTRQSCELMHTKYAEVHRSGACTAQCHNHSVAYFVDNGSGQVYGNFKFEPITKLAAFAPMQLSHLHSLLISLPVFYVRHWWHLWGANKRTLSDVHFLKWSICVRIIW